VTATAGVVMSGIGDTLQETLPDIWSCDLPSSTHSASDSGQTIKWLCFISIICVASRFLRPVCTNDPLMPSDVDVPVAEPVAPNVFVTIPLPRSLAYVLPEAALPVVPLAITAVFPRTDLIPLI